MMTHIVIFFSFLLFLLIICSSCKDEYVINNQTPQQITITASDFVKGSHTRTSILIDETAGKFTWAENDTIGIFPDKGSQAYFPMNNGAGSNSATFNGGGWALKPSSAYTAYYPFIKNFAIDKEAIPVHFNGQVQTGNASTNHLGKYDYMTTAANTPENGSVNFIFNHMSSLIQLKIDAGRNTKLTSVKLVSDQPVFIEEGQINLNSSSPKITPVKRSKEITVQLQDFITTSEKPLAIINFMMAPTDLRSCKLKAIVGLHQASPLQYSIPAPTKAFLPGMLYALSSELTPSESYTELISGKAFNEAIGRLCPLADITAIKFECFTNKKLPSNNVEVVSTSQSPLKAFAIQNNKEITIYTPADKIKLPSNSEGMFQGCSTIKYLDLRSFDTSEVTYMASMFKDCKGLASVNLSSFNTRNVTSMAEMFEFCNNLAAVDLSNFNTSKVTTMRGMFNGSGITSIDVSKFQTDEVTDMWAMFANTPIQSLDLTRFITDKVTDMGSMFNKCSQLSNLSLGQLNTSRVTNMSYMFLECKSLKELDLSCLNTSNVKYMMGMFAESGFTHLDLSHFNTSNVIDMDSMFRRCSDLRTLNLSNIETNNVTSMGSMFSNCNELYFLDLSSFDTHKVTSMTTMFENCSNLNLLEFGNSFIITKATNINDMCSNIKANTIICTEDLKHFLCDPITKIDTKNVKNWNLTATTNTYHVTTPGTLSQLIGESNKYNIERLKISGALNGSDIFFLKTIAESNHNTLENQGKLVYLDLSEAQIVAGGDPYISTYDEKVYTQDNIIGKDMFTYCTNLKEIRLPNNIEKIEDNAFYFCNNLVSVNIPNNLKTLGAYSFYMCINLVSLDLPNSIQQIGSSAFSGCRKLQAINIPTHLTTIPTSLFSDCSLLASLNLPPSITSIGEGAFVNCKNLRSINIPTGIKKINNQTFKNCSQLISLTLPEQLEEINTYAFEGCTRLTNINIPDSVCFIGGGAFINCSSLTTINIPAKVSLIGNIAFSHCTSLVSIKFKKDRTMIRYDLCEDFGISTPISIYLPSTMAILDHADLTYSCHSVYCFAPIPPKILIGGFKSTCKIFVPKGSIEKYKTNEYWKPYAANIYAIPDWEKE